MWFILKIIINLNLDDFDLEVEVINNKKILIIKVLVSLILF